MARAPGSKKTPGSGRKKGVPNRATASLQEKAEALGVDPFTILLLFAKGDHEALGLPEEKTVGFSQSGDEIIQLTIPAELRQKAANDAAAYLYPKRKAIEHSGAVGGPFEIFSSMTTEERARRLAELEKKRKKNV